MSTCTAASSEVENLLPGKPRGCTAAHEAQALIPTPAEQPIAPHHRSRQNRTDTPTSRWTQSLSKRLFDCGCVLLCLPLLLPVLFLVMIAVRFTSHGPVLFLQRRVGRFGTTFTIFKFRTMAHHHAQHTNNAVTTTENQRFTPIGPFLRRTKLDELPQLFNVLLGQMSLVGPRPKLPEHCDAMPYLPCRPGITGAATVAFAQEEKLLAAIPAKMLENFYHGVILPMKRELDSDYMSEATFVSDLRLLWISVLRRWDDSNEQSIVYSGLKTSRATDRQTSPRRCDAFLL